MKNRQERRERMKQAVGDHAARYLAQRLTRDTVIGVGAGSTVNCFIDALAASAHRFDGAVASSEATAARLAAHGIPVRDLNQVSELAISVDGADEVGADLALIKGGGGALTREKIVASVAREFLCIVDSSKQVATLGNFPLPVEVIPMARSAVARRLVALGGEPVWRQGFVTDNGNVILDVHGLTIDRPCRLEDELNAITGVVAHGLFAKRPADLLFVATPEGVREFRRP